MDANYSLALMLLLKYDCPQNPRTFVDDAIFLRENFNVTGGSKIIHKYSGKSPRGDKSSTPPDTPLEGSLSPRQILMRNRSSLTTPARFLQQQGGVEALIHGAAGAAKGVYNRGERLGINQAVRDAMEEVKKNMQGLQTPRSNNSPRRGAAGASRWSLDDGRVVPASTAIMATMNERNRQLAVMLDHAMNDLRSVSVSQESDREKCIEAMDIAIAKVDFVKVYLEDSTMPLPILSPEIDGGSEPAIPEADIPKVLLPSSSDDVQPTSPEQSNTPDSRSALIKEADELEKPSISTPDISQTSTEASDISSAEPSISTQPDTEREDMRSAISERPKAPIPTRSTIAQSSFSWMLEPDQASSPTTKPSPPKSSSPFLRSGKRPISGAGREKAAFLFGEDDGDFQLPIPKAPLPNSEEAFKLEVLKRTKEKQADEPTGE